MTDTLQYRFLFRRGTAAALAAANEVLLQGEGCKELDTGREKTGDGVTHYNDLPYTIAGWSDITDLQDGDTMLWDAARGIFVPGLAGAAIEEGDGISIETTSSGAKIISATYGAITLTGRVAVYANLPTGLGSGDDGKAYLVDADNLVYVWNGTAFQADGDGLPIGGGGVSGSDDALAAAILADTPKVYYRCNETSGTTIADSSGNGKDLTLTGTNVIGTEFLLNDTVLSTPNSTSAGAVRSDQGGIVVPCNYDWTIVALVACVGNAATTSVYAFTLSAVGETLATNAQFGLEIAKSTGQYLNMLWESGAGVNTQLTGPAIPMNSTSLIHMRKNTSAKTFDFFRNGRLLNSQSYTNEPAGGTTTSLRINNSGSSVASDSALTAHCAFFDSALSNARIRAHAEAAGFY